MTENDEHRADFAPGADNVGEKQLDTLLANLSIGTLPSETAEDNKAEDIRQNIASNDSNNGDKESTSERESLLVIEELLDDQIEKRSQSSLHGARDDEKMPFFGRGNEHFEQSTGMSI